MTDYSELKRRAQEIRDEVKAGANTANRVGVAIEKTIDAIELENQRAQETEKILDNDILRLSNNTADLPSIRKNIEKNASDIIIEKQRAQEAEGKLDTSIRTLHYDMKEISSLGEQVKELRTPVIPLVLNVNGQLSLRYGEGLFVRDGTLCASGTGGGGEAEAVYSEGAGIQIDANNIISVRLGNGFALDANGALTLDWSKIAWV